MGWVGLQIGMRVGREQLFLGREVSQQREGKEAFQREGTRILQREGREIFLKERNPNFSEEVERSFSEGREGSLCEGREEGVISITKVIKIKSGSCSVGNFAVKLIQSIFFATRIC